MATNIWVNPERFREHGQETHVNGMELIVQVSPYDIPTNIRGKYVRTSSMFEISFDYLDDETPRSPVVHNKIRLVLGKFSGKILKILIPVDSEHMSDIGLIELKTEVLDALQQHSEKLNPSNNASLPAGTFLNSEGVRDVLQDDQTFRTIAKELVLS